MPALLCRPSRRDALSFFTQAESAPITPTHPSVALPCRAGERWIDRVKSVAFTCDAQGRVQRYLSGSLNDTRTPSRIERAHRSGRKSDSGCRSDCKRSRRSSQADDDHAGTVVHGRDSDVRTNISAEGNGSPGNPDSRGWRRMGSRVGNRDARA